MRPKTRIWTIANMRIQKPVDSFVMDGLRRSNHGNADDFTRAFWGKIKRIVFFDTRLRLNPS